MKLASLLFCLVSLSLSSSSSSFARADFVDDHAKIISVVNSSPSSTWTAGVNSRFAQATYDQLKRLMGSLPEPQEQKLPLKVLEINTAAIPAEFDARTQWPQCPSIGEIRDQSDCGSCWAFGATEAATDRVCIGTNGASKPHLSSEDLLSCCGLLAGCGFGCNGGWPSGAWGYLTRTGVVTGGNYADESWCVAYSFPPCDHHVSGKYGPCPTTEYSTPSCASSCDSNSTYTTTYANDHWKFATSYSIGSDVSQIQTEILTNGPVEGSFTVYSDFPTYKSGVYQYTTGDELGGHAIKILGWGTESGVDYWLVANSWNPGWGDQGFFKIKRGTNECGIESGIVAGLYQSK